MNETEEIEDEWENPYSIYTTAGLSYKAMRLELGKKKVNVRLLDDEDIESVEESDHVISSTSGRKAKKLPKSKNNQSNDASQIPVETVENDSSNAEKENLDTACVRITRSRARLSNQSNISNCESNNQINTETQRTVARRGRRAQKSRRGRNNNATVLNAEPIEISDSPIPSPVASHSEPPAPGMPPTVQGESIELSDDSDTEVNKPLYKNLETSLTEDDNCEIPVRVWWKFGKIDKFNIRKYQKFASIFQQYAKQENVPEENILLMLKNVKIQQNDTPDSVGLVPGMIIEGGVCGNCHPSTAAASTKAVAEPALNKDGIEIRIQQKGKKTPLTLTINKTQKMKVLMLKCAEQLDLPVEKLKLYFDGEAVSSEDTPEDLDLEGDECMDLHVLQ